MHRFFVSPDRVAQGLVTFTETQARQLARVLRLRQGQRVVVLDGSGVSYLVRLEAVSPSAAWGMIEDQHQGQGEPVTRIVLHQGLLKADKWEWVLQKGTEVGISAFQGVACERSVAKTGPGVGAQRTRRFTSILQEAAEQCGRGRLPDLLEVQTWEEACLAAGGRGLVLYEGERTTRLGDGLRVLLPGREVHVLAGPEGGLTGREVEAAGAAGILPVTLGPRILRAETAGVIAAALVLYERGEI